jgi:hypothetical protein
MAILQSLNVSAIFKYVFAILVGLNIFAHLANSIEGLSILMLNNLFLSLWAG